MDSTEIWNWIISHIWSILLSLSVIIQITPIKINPWSTIIKWIGNIITGDIMKKINTLSDSINKINKNVMENEKDRIRWEVLDFANSCRNNRKHTRDEFQHIVSLHDKYIELLKLTDDTNGVFDVEYQYIKDLYAERMEKNDFL